MTKWVKCLLMVSAILAIGHRGAEAANFLGVSMVPSTNGIGFSTVYVITTGDPLEYLHVCFTALGVGPGSTLRFATSTSFPNGSCITTGSSQNVDLSAALQPGTYSVTLIATTFATGEEVARISFSGTFEPPPPPPPPDPTNTIVITSATRWRPQRDTTAQIAVAFTGPSDLDLATVRLSVSLPPGGPAAYAPTLTSVASEAGTSNQYTAKWGVDLMVSI